MNFGPALAVAFVLWPVMAVLGGQGFAPLLGLTSLAALALARPRLPPAAFALVGFAFTVWVVASEFWAPGELALTSGNLLEGTFAVESGSLATASLALSSCLVVAAALQSAPAPRASGIGHRFAVYVRLSAFGRVRRRSQTAAGGCAEFRP